MKFPTVRTTTITGAWLLRRAKNIAMQLLKNRMWGKTEVVDGYIIKASRIASQASAVVIDPPGAVYTRGTRQIGARDHFNSRVGLVDGPYDYSSTPQVDIRNFFYSYGFDPDAEDHPVNPNPWKRASPLPYIDLYFVKRDIVRSAGLIRYPPESGQLPIPAGATIFSGVHTHGAWSASTPGYWWSNQAMVALTGYGLARIADMFPLDYVYQGDAPVSAAQGAVTLVVTPLVKNGPVDIGEGVVDWGQSAVRFALIEAGEDRGPSTTIWSRVWAPDEHSCSFFHNGPWLSWPDMPSYFSVVVPTDGITAWRDWWRAWEDSGSSPAVPAGGMRPNWTDCMAVTWFNGRFVVIMRVAAINGAYTPPDPGLSIGSYFMAGGHAYMRFDIGLDGEFVPSEESYEIWNSPAQYGLGGDGDPETPYGIWVEGVLDEQMLHCVIPTALLSTENWMVEVRWCMEADRNDVLRLGAASHAVRFGNRADMSSCRLEFKVTTVDGDGSESLPVTHAVLFSELDCGIEGPPFRLGAGIDILGPPVTVKYRACDPQFVVLSSREIGFLARKGWRMEDGTDNMMFVVFDLDTRAATVRSDTGLIEAWTSSHMLCSHLDCIQQTIYDENGETTLHGVLLATSRRSSKSRISRDSGHTWSDYLTDIPTPSDAAIVAYYIGNQYGGGARPGHAVI